ncbi:MAG: hypothetical protein QNI84_07925 [Henriciella sp.]|nr:hypothetical protein [Henriciella sp.]
MRPGWTPEQLEAASAPHVQIATLFEFDYPGDPVRLHAGYGVLEVDGKQWLGVGLLGQVADVSEDLTGRVSGASYVLSGVNTPEGAALVEKIKQIDRDDLKVSLYVALFDPVTGEVIGSARTLRSDYYDTAIRRHDANTATITVTAEPPGLDRSAIGFRRYSPADQRAEFPDDKGMDFQPSVGVEPITLAV